MGRFDKPVVDPEKLGLNGPKSRLMYDYLRVLQSVQRANPDVKFVCENVVFPCATRTETKSANFWACNLSC